jgi:phosphoenolpyruvate carboxykinase (ATP)
MQILEASQVDLTAHGLTPKGCVRRNLSPARLYEETLRLGTGRIAHGGGLVTVTTPHTGRSPNDRFVVHEPDTADMIDWGPVNVPISVCHYDRLRTELIEHLNGIDLYVRDAKAGADPRYGINVRVISESPWHDLFAHNMFLRLDPGEQDAFEPDFVVYHAPSVQADPERHGTNSGAFIVVNFTDRVVLVGGTAYAGEIKKSIFASLNFLLPARGVLPMHCSANIGDAGDTALFFGLSGTGKTTLSANPDRQLIGDDEHGWSHDGLFNFEGGCYAKVIRLSPTAEPAIHATTRMFGTVLENVVMDPDSRVLDLDDGSHTENTRGAYPLASIPNASSTGVSGHPTNIVMLTADAFGVMPPIARLTAPAATYHFLSGYTAKVAGTERGVTEPKATFSACFGAPFMVHHPTVYARLLGGRIATHGARVWLVNTGWSGGPYGVGSRMAIGTTRALISAALSGKLDDVSTERDPVFNVDVPLACPGVPPEALRPRSTWADPSGYDAQARKLAGMFADNFRAFEADADAETRAAGPRA